MRLPCGAPRYSEKLLQHAGISVNTLDLSEVFSRANATSDADRRVKEKIEDITGYAASQQVPGSALMRMAKLAIVRRRRTSAASWAGRTCGN
jgi:L-fucose isomerase-like protein